jgi:chemotaxis protein MotB
MARMPQWIGKAVLGLAVTTALTGCVSQEKYNALKLRSDRLTEQLANAEKDSATARAEADLYKKSLDAIKGNGDNQTGLIANLTTQNGALQAQLDELNRKYAEAIGKMGTLGTALPIALTNELSAFAAANPDLVEFDSARGIVKFKSDLTFALGSDALKPEAKAAIAKFATIVNSPAASGYELLVAGHTDNIRVSNPATIQAGHKDNWYLSAHRAISVGKELIGHSTNPQRIGVIGYADQRPAASNDSEGGRSKNRRVEVLILPTTVRTGPVASTPTSAKPAAKPVLNKDSSATIDTPSMNK